VPERDHGGQVADAIGRLLLRSSRAHLYSVLTADVGGVDETTYPVLSGLARTGTVTASELAAEIGLERTVTTRYASRLAAAGLLARRAHPTDARATNLMLTDRGRLAVEGMRERLHALIDDAMAQWTPEERTTFGRLFDQVVTAITHPGP
jgi:DNA-binding MarR family transcriptional regulator